MATRKKDSGKAQGPGGKGGGTDVVNEAHESLVKSLESIKELLLKSENKISAARENIARADRSRQGHADPASTEDDSPPLFDLADNTDTTSPAGQEADDAAVEENIDAFLADIDGRDPPPGDDDDVPMLEDIVVPGKPATEDTDTDANTPTLSADTIEAIMNEFQKNLEKKVHDTLIQVIVQLESDLKAQIREEVEALRRQLLEDRD